MLKKSGQCSLSTAWWRTTLPSKDKTRRRCSLNQRCQIVAFVSIQLPPIIPHVEKNTLAKGSRSLNNSGCFRTSWKVNQHTWARYELDDPESSIA